MKASKHLFIGDGDNTTIHRHQNIFLLVMGITPQYTDIKTSFIGNGDNTTIHRHQNIFYW